MLITLQFKWAECRLPQNGFIVNFVVLLSEMSILWTILFLDCYDTKKQWILKRNNFLLVMDRIFQKEFGDLPWKNGRRSLSEREDWWGSKQARLVWAQVALCVRAWMYTSKQARHVWLRAHTWMYIFSVYYQNSYVVMFFIQFQVLSPISKSLLLFLSLQSSVLCSCNPVLMEFWTSKWYGCERELSNGGPGGSIFSSEHGLRATGSQSLAGR